MTNGEIKSGFSKISYTISEGQKRYGKQLSAQHGYRDIRLFEKNIFFHVRVLRSMIKRKLFSRLKKSIYLIKTKRKIKRGVFTETGPK